MPLRLPLLPALGGSVYLTFALHHRFLGTLSPSFFPSYLRPLLPLATLLSCLNEQGFSSALSSLPALV